MKKITLCRILKDELNLDLKDPTTIIIASGIVRYITGADTAYDFQKFLKQHIDFADTEYSAKDVRMRLIETAYISQKLKYFSYCLAKYKRDDENLNRFSEEFKIDRNDTVMLKKVFLLKGFRRELRKAPKVESLTKQDVSYDAYLEMSNVFDRIYPQLIRWTKSITYKKLRFITHNTNTEPADFHGELLCKALKTFHKLVPINESELYIENYIKRTLTNQTINIIKEHTTQKRGRVIKGECDGFGGDKFHLVVVSENQMHLSPGETNPEYDSMQNDDANNDEINRRDSELNVESILRNFGKKGKKKALLKLMSGEDHAGFTLYLRKCKIIEHDKDNVDYYNRVKHSTYLKRICSYLDIKYSRACRFLNYVGRKAFPDKVVNGDTNAKQSN